MYAQAAVKPNPLLRNGAYGIVMRGVQKCTRGCSSLRGRNRLPLCCIKLDTATDPAVGSGAFPLGMLFEIVKIRDNITDYFASMIESDKDKRRIYEERSRYYLKRYTISNCIYGVDIEASSVDITKLRLWLSLVVDTESGARIGDHVFGETKQKQTETLPTLDGNILCGNSLVSEYEEMHYIDESGKVAARPFFTWEVEFARVFQKKKGFDVVIGNPPYIKERDNRKVFEWVNNTEFGRKYHQGKMDYWYYFLHKAISLINPEGTITYITPRYWLNSAGASLLIERIKKELSFVQVVDIGKLEVFHKVMGYHMIAQYQLKNASASEFTYKRLENSLDDLAKDYNTPNISVKVLNNQKVISENNEINFEEASSFGNALTLDNAVLLGNICSISQGVVEASDRVSKKLYHSKPREDASVGKGIFVLSSEEIKELGFTEVEKAVLVKYLEGDSISRYHIRFDERYLIYSDKEIREKIVHSNDFANIKSHLDNMADYITSSNKPYGLHRPRRSEYFTNQKIIVPSMFKDNDFAMDTEGEYYVGMSYSVIIQADPAYPLEYILAILNSDIAREWFYKNGKHRGVGVDIGVDKLRTFPIVKSDSELMNSIVGFVRQLMDYRRSGAEEPAAELDKRINELVQRIYVGE